MRAPRSKSQALAYQTPSAGRGAAIPFIQNFLAGLVSDRQNAVISLSTRATWLNV